MCALLWPCWLTYFIFQVLCVHCYGPADWHISYFRFCEWLCPCWLTYFIFQVLCVHGYGPADWHISYSRYCVCMVMALLIDIFHIPGSVCAWLYFIFQVLWVVMSLLIDIFHIPGTVCAWLWPCWLTYFIFQVLCVHGYISYFRFCEWLCPCWLTYFIYQVLCVHCYGPADWHISYFRFCVCMVMSLLIDIFHIPGTVCAWLCPCWLTYFIFQVLCVHGYVPADWHISYSRYCVCMVMSLLIDIFHIPGSVCALLWPCWLTYFIFQVLCVHCYGPADWHISYSRFCVCMVMSLLIDHIFHISGSVCALLWPCWLTYFIFQVLCVHCYVPADWHISYSRFCVCMVMALLIDIFHIPGSVCGYGPADWHISYFRFCVWLWFCWLITWPVWLTYFIIQVLCVVMALFIDILHILGFVCGYGPADWHISGFGWCNALLIDIFHNSGFVCGYGPDDWHISYFSIFMWVWFCWLITYFIFQVLCVVMALLIDIFHISGCVCGYGPADWHISYFRFCV